MICYIDKLPCNHDCCMYDLLNKLCLLAEEKRIDIEWARGSDMEEGCA